MKDQHKGEDVIIWNSARLLASELADNITKDIRRAYAKGLTRDAAAKIVTGEPCAFRVHVVVEKLT